MSTSECLGDKMQDYLWKVLCLCVLWNIRCPTLHSMSQHCPAQAACKPRLSLDHKHICSFCQRFCPVSLVSVIQSKRWESHGRHMVSPTNRAENSPEYHMASDQHWVWPYKSGREHPQLPGQWLPANPLCNTPIPCFLIVHTAVIWTHFNSITDNWATASWDKRIYLQTFNSSNFQKRNYRVCDFSRTRVECYM